MHAKNFFLKFKPLSNNCTNIVYPNICRSKYSSRTLIIKLKISNRTCFVNMLMLSTSPLSPSRLGGRNKPAVGLRCPAADGRCKRGPLRCEGDNDRRTESGEGLPLGFDSSQPFTHSPTAASSVSASVSTNLLFADMTGNAVLTLLLILYLSCAPGRVGTTVVLGISK